MTITSLEAMPNLVFLVLYFGRSCDVEATANVGPLNFESMNCKCKLLHLKACIHFN
jgi:hypothetical protein